MEEPDPQLIAAARSGDLGAFETLVRRYQANVYRFVVNLTSDASVAEDITQETFVRAFRSLRRYRGESRFTTWLFSIARNCAVDDARRSARRSRLATRLREREVPASSDGPVGLEVREALARLPTDLREPVLLIDLLGFSYSEVARMTRVREGTIKSRMHRARRLLIEALAPPAAEDSDEI